MDTNVAGLNKVVCIASGSSDNGKAVTITDGVNTWSGTISSITGIGYACIFMIPSMPAPAKKTYTVNLHTSDASSTPTYTRDIELGFGDSVRIGLYQNDEIVKIGSVPKATASRIGGFKTNEGTSNGIYMSGDYLQLKTATGSQKGGVKVPSGGGYGLYMDDDSLRAKIAGTSQLGSVKIGDGINIDPSTGTISLKAASDSQLGGIKVGNGLTKNSSNVLSVNAQTGLYSNAQGLYLYTASDSQLGGIKIGNGLQISSGVAKVKASTGISVSSSGVALGTLTREDIEVNCTEEMSIASLGYDVDSVTITTASVKAKLDKGVIEYIDTDNSFVMANIYSFYKNNSDNYVLSANLFNPTNGAKIVKKLVLHIAYHS